ncbi:MAG: hypothetical protein FJZ88_07290 [Chloroflexi bacterium]|nr:hypothetical protein [Chloroflexota bacterium]
MVGAPKAETKTEVQHILQQSGIDRLLRVDSAPPSPEHSFFSLPLYGLLTFETFISMTPKDKRSYEPLIGIEVVHPRDEMELDLLTVLSGDDAMPILLRVIGRNLRRWIDEPKLDSSIDVNRVIQHAYELRHIGAVRAAGITAGTALELLLVKWSGLAEERVRAERTTLGRLIEKSQNLLNLSADAVTELKRFSRLRNQCAHALAEGTIEDNQLGEEVDRFLKWLTERANA